MLRSAKAVGCRLATSSVPRTKGTEEGKSLEDQVDKMASICEDIG